MAGVSPARLDRMRSVLERRTRRLLLVLDDVHKARNAGALLRTADAVGIQEIHAIENRSPFLDDPETSVGAGQWLDLVTHRRDDFPPQHKLHPPEVALEPGAQENVRRTLVSLKARGYRIAVSDLSADSISLDQVPVDQPLALVVGNEFAGASPVARELADFRFSIPMHGFAQSLNLAVFAGIALHALAERMRALPNWSMEPEDQQATLARWIADQA